METRAFRSRAEAESEAVRWLETLADDDVYRWDWDTPTTLACEPYPGFPCRVMAWTAEDAGGFVPCYAFTAGLKYQGRYWQGRLTDENGRPLPPGQAISELKGILGVLVPASRAFIPG